MYSQICKIDQDHSRARTSSLCFSLSLSLSLSLTHSLSVHGYTLHALTSQNISQVTTKVMHKWTENPNACGIVTSWQMIPSTASFKNLFQHMCLVHSLLSDSPLAQSVCPSSSMGVSAARSIKIIQCVNIKRWKSPRDLHLNTSTQLHSTTSKPQCWTTYAKQLAKQEHNPTH